MTNEPWTEDQHPVYLGDGVYAWDDGYHIWISTQRNLEWEKIAFDKDVWRSLVNYVLDRRAKNG